MPEPSPAAARRWQKLVSLAETEVQATLAALPAELQAEARKLPITYEPKPSRLLRDDDVDEDTLGLFIGEEWSASEAGNTTLPPQIMLFLENLWDFAERHEDIYRDEVRTTLLHELGHYLGLDEGELEQRGLE